MACANIVGIAAVAGSQIQVSVWPKRDRSAVVITRVLTEGDNLTARSWIDKIRVGSRHLPFGNDVHVVLLRVIRRRKGRRRGCFARVRVELVESRAGGIIEVRMKRQAEEPALIV